MGFAPAAIAKFKVGGIWVLIGVMVMILVVFVWAQPLTTEGQALLAEVVLLPFLLIGAIAAIRRKAPATKAGGQGQGGANTPTQSTP